MTRLLFSLALFLAVAPAQAEGPLSKIPNPKPVTITPSVKEKVLRFRLHGEPTTLDWSLAHTAYEGTLLRALMAGLVQMTPDLKAVPALAESWEIDEGGTRYTFKLRKGVKWSDGAPLVAQHFVDSWKRLLSPLTAASYAYFLFDVVGAEDFNAGKHSDFSLVGVKAPDEHTIQVRLKQPVAHWLYIPTFWVCYPIRLDVIEKYGVGWERPGKIVTLGPYLLSQYDEGRKYTLLANPNYFEGRAKVDRVEGIVVQSAAEAIEKFKKGELDVVSQLGAVAADAAKDPKLVKHLKRETALRTFYLAMNTARFPTSQPKFRQAIAAALNLAEVEKEGTVRGEAASSWVPRGLLGYDKTLRVPFDPARAAALLKQGGLDSSSLPELELLSQDQAPFLGISNWVAQSLKKNLGLKVKVNALPIKAYAVRRQMRTAELLASSWMADFPDADNFLSVFIALSGNNFTQWQSAAYDALVAKAKGVAAPPQRLAVYREAQKLLQVDNAVIVPIAYETAEVLVSERVGGVEVGGLYQVAFDRAFIR